MAKAIFVCLNVLLFPVTLAGYALWIAKMIVSPPPPGVSRTAQGPLSARWFQHRLGTRQDEAACRLMAVLPGVSPLALRLVAGPVLLGHRVTGYVPKAFRYPFEGEVPVQYEASARQTFIDGVLDREFHAVSQVVVLGAGFDTRAYGRPAGETLRWFEVDTPATQAVKKKALADAGIGPARVTFVSADFRREDWLARLIASGFDLEQPSMFVWEGVLMYLDRSAVETTFRKIAGVAARSMVVFDYFTQEPLRSGSLYWRFARATTRLVGEPLAFGLDSTPPVRDQLSTFLAEQGLALGEHRELGREEGRHRAWAGFAAALVR